MEIKYYADQTAEMKISVMRGEMKISEFKIAPEYRGYHSLPYHFHIPEETAVLWNETFPDSPIKKADNMKYYLPPGEYQVRLEQNGKTANRTIILYE